MVILQQYYLKCLAHASYLIGDEESRVAAIVDPQRDIDQYLDVARAHHLQIRHVFLTHLHADFVAGHLELRDRVGATIYIGRAAEVEYPHVPLAEGDVVEFGRVRIQARETPGHTPESVSLLVFDLAVSATVPHAVLTGDTLFIGDVGRPDLMAAPGSSADDLASQLYDSLRETLLALPDETLVYPAHGAGSLCGRALSQETVSTIGEQRRVNYALQPMTREAFIGMVTADQPDAPPYFAYDAAMNAKERPTLDASLNLQLVPMTLDAVLAAHGRGAQVLDTRESVDFAAAHLAGSVNVGLAGQYATWAGTVLDRERPIVIIAESGQEREAALRLGRIGFDHVLGYLDEGMAALESRSDLVATTERLSPDVAASRLASTTPPQLIDVRTPVERAVSRIAGSVHLPLNRLRDQLPGIDRDRPVLLYCAGGYRSSLAASLLQDAGIGGVAELAGGITAWEALRLPVETAPERPPSAAAGPTG